MHDLICVPSGVSPMATVAGKLCIAARVAWSADQLPHAFPLHTHLKQLAFSDHHDIRSSFQRSFCCCSSSTSTCNVLELPPAQTCKSTDRLWISLPCVKRSHSSGFLAFTPVKRKDGAALYSKMLRLYLGFLEALQARGMAGCQVRGLSKYPLLSMLS